jgi:hypothetical protein
MSSCAASHFVTTGAKVPLISGKDRYYIQSSKPGPAFLITGFLKQNFVRELEKPDVSQLVCAR